MQAIAQQPQEAQRNNRHHKNGNRKRKNQQDRQNAAKRSAENRAQHGYLHYQQPQCYNQGRLESRRHENWRTSAPLWTRNQQQQTSGAVPLMSLPLAPSHGFQRPLVPVLEEVPKQKTREDMMAMLQKLQTRGLLKPSAPKTEAEIWDQLSRPKQKVRNQTLVDNLLKSSSKSCCKFCGLKFDDPKSQFAKDHLDEHVQKHLQRISNKVVSAQQPWYTTSFLAPAAPTKSAPGTSETIKGVVSSGSKITKCSVCEEKFEEVFDDDEETWRFKDTIKKLGNVVHLGCASEVTEDMALVQKVKKEEQDDDIIYLY